MANGYDISDERRAKARRVAQRASHDSVTEALLCGQGRFSNNFYLYDLPLVAHLDDSEQPHFGFYNERKGIGVDSKRNTRSPDEGGITAILLTDRRVLAVIGKADGDERLTIPYDVVTGASSHTGIMKHRIAVDTVDTTYHLWINSGYGEATLQEAVELLEQKRSGGQTAQGGTAADAGSPGLAESDGGAQNDDERSGNAPGSDSSANGSTAGGSSGSGVTVSSEDPLDRLERLQALHEKGAITDREFREKKQDLLDQI